MLPLRLVLAVSLVAPFTAGCPSSGAGHAGDAGQDAATSAAPAFETAPTPAPPPPAATTSSFVEKVPPPPPPRCPRGMVLVDRRLCVDKWEASLVDKPTGLSLSPYYPPDRRLAAQIHETWDKQRLEVGSRAAREMPLPPLPEWQTRREVDPMAVSRPNVVPNGYVSGVLAARACANAGKRLCTHDEWVRACKGAEPRRFPYGDEYKQSACNIFRAVHPATELHDNPSIGHLDPRLNLVEEAGKPLLRRTGTTTACKSVWGGEAAWDMNGNLDEWVEDEHGRFDGGFFSRSKRDGCESTITAHPKSYFDYSTGVRCCSSLRE